MRSSPQLHLNRHSPFRSSGSSPSSHLQTSSGGTGTNTGHSRGQTGSSGQTGLSAQTGTSGHSLTYPHPLNHSPSLVSEDGRRWRTYHNEISPPISAVGRSSMVPMIPSPRPSSPSSGSSNTNSVSPNASLVRGGPPRPASTNPFGPPRSRSPPPPTQSVVPSHMQQVQNGTVTSTGTAQTGGTGTSSVTTHTSVVVDPVTGQVMRLPSVPWTGGLGFDYGVGGGNGYGDANSSLGGSWGSPSHLRALREGMGMGGDGDQSAGSHT